MKRNTVPSASRFHCGRASLRILPTVTRVTLAGSTASSGLLTRASLAADLPRRTGVSGLDHPLAEGREREHRELEVLPGERQADEGHRQRERQGEVAQENP